ncbi:hypothetical protein HUB97_06905 [Halorubraceae archaeon YAN]|nr:hypothetical protein [Halorubraceae archaeon YAN]
MTENIATTIVETVAANENVEPTDLPPLHYWIDTDALARVVETGATRVEFEYVRYTVVVSNTEITVQ